MDTTDTTALTLADYMAILRRRFWRVLLVATLLFGLATGIVFALPDIYRSSATILIEQQEIPVELVQSTVTTFASQRLQQIRARVMTTTTLLGIVDKFDLYAKERAREPTEVILEKMQDDIVMSTIDADVVDPRTGRPMSATLAFALSFESESPRLAQQVTNELVSLYLNENLKSRAQLTSETEEFLSEEADKTRRQVAELERKLADFKSEHADSLPEIQSLNRQFMERAKLELDSVTSRLSALEERRIYLDAEIAKVKANFSSRPIALVRDQVLEPADQLRALRSQYLSASSIYSSRHPDVVRLRREIASLEAVLGKSDGLAELEEQIDIKRSAVIALQQRYAASHPDVRRAERELAKLESRRATTLKELDGVPPKSDIDYSNPAEVQLRSQLDALAAERKSLEQRATELRARMTEMENRLIATPAVEREYNDLLREVAAVRATYEQLRAKADTARIASSLETDRKGERFTLIEPPLLPEQPEWPNRRLLLLLGLFVAFGAGVGSAAISEAFDQSLHGKRDVQRILNAPILGAIPVIRTPRERAKRRLTIVLIALLVIALIAGALLAIHLFHTPIDTLWYSFMRQLETKLAL